MKKLLFSALLLFPLYTFSFFKKQSFFHPSFQKIEINGPALKDASYIKIYTGKHMVIKLSNLAKSIQKKRIHVDFYRSGMPLIFRMFSLYRGNYSWDYKNLEKFSDIKDTLNARRSVIMYFNKKNQAIAYIIADFRIGAIDPKFEGIDGGRRVWLSKIQDSLIARCKSDVTGLDLSWNSLGWYKDNQ